MTITQLQPGALTTEPPGYAFRPVGADRTDKDGLGASIAAEGILVPPLILRDQTALLCLSGNRRIRAAIELGLQKIPCRIIDPTCPVAKHYSLLIHHAQLGAQLSPVQQAGILRTASRELPEQELLPLLAILGYKPHAYLLRQLLQVLQLPNVVQLALHRGELAFRLIPKLSLLPPDDQQTVTELFRDLQLGGSKQQAVLEGAVELHKRTAQPFSVHIAEWRQGLPEKANAPQQAASLLKWIDLELHPRKRRADAEFQQFIRELNLPEAIRVTPEKGYESDRVAMTVDFPDRSTLAACLTRIRPLLPPAQG